MNVGRAFRRLATGSHPISLRRHALPASGGSALSVFGPAAPVCEALLREASRSDPLAIVVASSAPALRRVLECAALKRTDVVGVVDAAAFAASPSDGDGDAHVVLADAGRDLELVTFDSHRGALPEFGPARLERALDARRAPHFLVFAGERRSEGGDGERSDADEWLEALASQPGAILEAFARRVDGLFGPSGSCSGVVARTAGDLPPRRNAAAGRLVHARRRQIGRKRRAGRLKVYDASRGHGAIVGAALLPRDARDDAAARATADALARISFGGPGTKRLWAATDGATGDARQRCLCGLMAFYDAWDRLDVRAMADAWCKTSAPSCVHPGGPPVVGRDAVIQSWRDRIAPYTVDWDTIGLVVDAVALDVDGATARVTNTCESPNLEAVAVAATSVLREADDGTWRLAAHHASLMEEHYD